MINERLCIACRTKKNKSDLIRIVRGVDNNYFIDTTYKINGRGAYVCKNQECIMKCINKKLLNKTFKKNIGTNIYLLLNEYLEKNISFSCIK